MNTLTINDVGAMIGDLKTEVSSRFNALPALIQQIVQDNQQAVYQHISEQVNAKLAAVYEDNLERDNRIDNLERIQLLTDLIIHGIPKFPSEDIHIIFQNICTKIKFDIPICNTITSLFRIKQERNSKPSIIVKFVSQNVRNNFLSLFGKSRGLILKDIGIEADGRIFVNESLSKLNLQIFRYAMSLKKTNAIAGVTTYNGIVQIRRLKTDSYIRVASISAVDEILDDDNDNNLTERTSATVTAPKAIAEDVNAHISDTSEPIVMNSSIGPLPSTLLQDSLPPPVSASPAFLSTDLLNKSSTLMRSSRIVATSTSTSRPNTRNIPPAIYGQKTNRILRNNSKKDVNIPA